MRFAIWVKANLGKLLPFFVEFLQRLFGVFSTASLNQ